jgi:hypothetical protein
VESVSKLFKKNIKKTNKLLFHSQFDEGSRGRSEEATGWSPVHCMGVTGGENISTSRPTSARRNFIRGGAHGL